MSDDPQPRDDMPSGAEATEGDGDDRDTSAALPQTQPQTEGAPASAPPVIGHHEILEEVGRGGMGVVYKAFDPGLKRVVALKVLIAGQDASPDALERFGREAQAVAQLGSHPHIVPIYGTGADGQRWWMALHFVEGKTLSRAIADGDVTPKRAARIAHDMADALAHAHGRGILHRDVKPANILLSRDGVPRITDFGLARNVACDPRLTASGTTLGTPPYMPPEQARGARDTVDERSDIYSLGATLYEMLTGVPPFDGTTVSEILLQVVNDEPVPARKRNLSVPPDLATICHKCLHKDPSRRYGSASALAADLERFLDGRPIAARPVSAMERVVRRLKRNPLAAAAAGATLLLVVAGTVALLAGLHKSRQMKRSMDDAQVQAHDAAQKARHADALLKKNRQVTAVIQKVSHDLAGPYRKLDTVFHTDLPLGEKRRATRDVWPEIEAYESRIPSDSASRSAWFALKGWLRGMAAFDEDAAALYRQSLEADPHVALGLVMQAMAHLNAYMDGLVLPPVTWSGEGVAFGDMPGETADMIASKKRFQEMLDEVSQRTAWGETRAAEFEGILRSLKGLWKGDLEGAENALTRAIALPEMVWARANLRLARAKVRYLRKRFENSLGDFRALVERYPKNLGIHFLLGDVRAGQAFTIASRGGDPRQPLALAIRHYSAQIEQGHLVRHSRIARAVLHVKLGQVEAAFGDRGDEQVKRAIAEYEAMLSDGDGLAELYAERGKARQVLAGLLADRGDDGRDLLTLAIEDFDAALARDRSQIVVMENRMVAHIALGEAMWNRGQPAEPHFQRALTDAMALRKLRPEDARAMFNAAAAHVWVGRVLARAGRDPQFSFEQGISLYERSLKLDPKNGEALANLGETWGFVAENRQTRGRGGLEALEQSRAAFERAAEIPSVAVRALDGLGKTCYRMGVARSRSDEDPSPFFEQALGYFDRAVREFPDAVSPRLNRGGALVRIADALEARDEDPTPWLRRALKDLSFAIEANSGQAEAHSNRALVRERLGERAKASGQDPMPWFRDAIDDCTRAIDIRPDFANAYNHRANIRMRLAEMALAKKDRPDDIFKSAIADYEKAVTCDKSHPLWRLNLAVARKKYADALTDRGENALEIYGKAAVDGREAVALNPGYFDGHDQLGNILLARGQALAGQRRDPSKAFLAAAEHYEKAAAIRPGAFNPKHNLGCTYYLLAEWEYSSGSNPETSLKKAIQACQAAMAVTDRHPLTHYNLGRALKIYGLDLASRGEDGRPMLEKAIDAWARATALAPPLWQVDASRGQLLESLGRFDEARRAYEKGLAVVGDRYPPLRAWRDKAAQAGAWPPWLRRYALGANAFNRDGFDEARPNLEQALALATKAGVEKDDAARVKLGMACFDLACIEAAASAGKNAPKATPRKLADGEAKALLDKALAYLERAASFGFSDGKALRDRDELAPLRESERFKALLGRMD